MFGYQVKSSDTAAEMIVGEDFDPASANKEGKVISRQVYRQIP